MILKSAAFRGNRRLALAGDNNPPLALGETSHGVALVQAALITLTYKLPISIARKHGAPDGVFGGETDSAIRKFQTDQKLKADGIAGHKTLLALDGLLPPGGPEKPPELPKPVAPPPAKPAPPPVVPPKAAPPKTVPMPLSQDFKIGTDDPKIVPDKGAGPWNSKPKEILMRVKKVGIIEVLGPAYVIIGDDAVKHMAHYLNNSGNPLTIDLEGMVAEVPSAKLRFETEVERIKLYVQQLPPGTFDVTSTHAVNGYNGKGESTNWFFAVGGYSVWTKGRATITGSGPKHDCKLELEYKFYDRYNWDGGKKVTIAGIEITDEAMGEFHRQGLAQEYDEIGAFRRVLTWKAP